MHGVGQWCRAEMLKKINVNIFLHHIINQKPSTSIPPFLQR
jgi:hypothetical protein